MGFDPTPAERAKNRALFGQPLAHQPFLDDLGDLVRVLVLHQHVGIPLDADLGEVDPIYGAAPAFTALAYSVSIFLNVAQRGC